MRMRIVNFLLLCGVLLSSSTAYSLEKTDISIVLMSQNAEDQEVSDNAQEFVISKFSAEQIKSSGKEMFGFDSDDQIRQCLSDSACVQKKASERQIARVFYGLITRNSNADSGDKKIKKPKSIANTLDIRLTMHNVLENRDEMTWVNKKIDPAKLTSEVLPDIATEAISLYKQNPQKWDEKEPIFDPMLAKIGQPETTNQPKPVVANESVEKHEAQNNPDTVQGVNLPDPNTSGLDWHFWTSISGASVGVILISAGGYYGIKSSTASDNYDATNIQTQAKSFKEEAESAGTTANIMFATGGALIAGSAVFYVLDQFGVLDSQPTPQVVFMPQNGAYCLNFSF